MFTFFPPVCPITTASNATAPAAQSPGFVSLPGCVQTATTTVQPTHTMVSLPGCVHTATTTVQPTHTMMSLPTCVHTAETMCCGDTGSQPQAQTVLPTIFPTMEPVCLPITVVCGPGPVIPPAHGGHQAQAQGVVGPTAYPGCVHNTIIGQTAYPGCAPVTQPPACFGPTAYLHCVPVTQAPACVGPTGYVGCLSTLAHTGGGQSQNTAPAQAQAMLSAFPCPTVATCPPTWNCGGQAAAPAQAQFPTISMECLKTATHVATAVLGCGALPQAQAPAANQGMVSAVPCPTVATCAPTWNCPATTSAETCLVSAYPCPTVATCAPTWNCGGQAAAPAQAQFPTLSLSCTTVVTVTV